VTAHVGMQLGHFPTLRDFCGPLFRLRLFRTRGRGPVREAFAPRRSRPAPHANDLPHCPLRAELSFLNNEITRLANPNACTSMSGCISRSYSPPQCDLSRNVQPSSISLSRLSMDSAIATEGTATVHCLPPWRSRHRQLQVGHYPRRRRQFLNFMNDVLSQHSGSGDPASSGRAVGVSPRLRDLLNAFLTQDTGLAWASARFLKYAGILSCKNFP
jgi:hypothetical protein